jgi:hypothetical protein
VNTAGGLSPVVTDAQDPDAKTSTFLVTAADEDSAVLKDVADGQVHTLSSNPGVSTEEAVEGTVAPEPPLNVSWRLADVDRQWTLSLERSDERPTALARDIAANQPVGELTRRERAGTGELHVITVPDAETEQAVEDVLDDRETTLARAARLGVARVELRAEPGVVVVRYMP